MNLDTVEIERISERLIALGNRGKLLATYIAVQAADSVICSEMGLRPHEVAPTISTLCDELGVEKVSLSDRRLYVRAAVLHVVPPPPPPPPPLPKIRLKRLSTSQRSEVETMVAGFLRASQRTSDPVVAAMLAATPNVLGFAISLCGNMSLAEELLQEGLSRAYANLHTFQPGANLKANIKSWLMTIVSNHFQSEFRRKRRREVEDPDGEYAETLTTLPDQIDRLEVRELDKALAKIPEEQRHALMLVAVEGLSYEEAADICGCAVGTIKSRVNRARSRLAELLGVEPGDEGPGGMFLDHGSEEETD